MQETTLYREFCYTGEPLLSIMELKGIEKNTILIDSVSKRYSACGVGSEHIGNQKQRNNQYCFKIGMARLSLHVWFSRCRKAGIDTTPDYFETAYKEYFKRRNFLSVNI